jgi:transcriptional regulator with XRE-family HTH domain
LKDATYRTRYRQFLERFGQARQEAGLTQIQVAMKFHRLQSFVLKCESGERRVDVVELQGFARLGQKLITFFCL